MQVTLQIIKELQPTNFNFMQWITFQAEWNAAGKWSHAPTDTNGPQFNL